jgi:glycosyltransferase involved in cell wall biosynthesis
MTGQDMTPPISLEAGSTTGRAPAPQIPPSEPTAAPPLRVLFVTARYVPYVGGTETHTYEVARRLAARGHEVTVLTTDPSKRLPALEQAEGVRVLRVPAWPANKDYYLAPAIYQSITHGSWDIMHCQGYHSLVTPLALLAARRHRTPYIVSFHSGGHSSRLRNALRGAQRVALRPFLVRAERLVAVSTFEAEFFRTRLRLPREQVVVIPNGSDIVAGAAARPMAVRRHGPLVVSVGRLERYKGHHRVIGAMGGVLEHYPDARLRIVGSGPYEAPLRQMAHAYGIDGRVHIGGVPAHDRHGLLAVLADAAVVTLLSEYEAHPIAVMEAAALGRPVVVADTSGLRELATRGLARAIPLESTPQQVATALLEQLRQPMAPAPIALPTWDACAASLLALYRSVLGSRPCAS